MYSYKRETRTTLIGRILSWDCFFVLRQEPQNPKLLSIFSSTYMLPVRQLRSPKRDKFHFNLSPIAVNERTWQTMGMFVFYNRIYFHIHIHIHIAVVVVVVLYKEPLLGADDTENLHNP